MNCDFSEKLSMLIDGELSVSDAARILAHVNECPVCKQLEQEFLGLRHEIKSYEPDADLISQRQTLWKVLASQNVPLWRRKIALPIPVFALVVFALLAFGAWSVFVRTGSPRGADLEKRINKLPVAAATNSDASAPDLSRFDRGERAVLYKERRSDAGVAGGKGANQ